MKLSGKRLDRRLLTQQEVRTAKQDTLPKLLLRNREKYGDRKVAMRKKDFGMWREYTWKDYYEKVKFFSLGLISLGLEPRDKVGIIGDNDPEWYWAEIATQAARGMTFGIFTDCTPTEVKWLLQHSDARFVVSKDQEQTDKILLIMDELPLKLRKVIYWDAKGLQNYTEPILASFTQVLELGKEYEKAHPVLFEQNIEKGCGDDVAFICWTSGTTGNPKGAMLTHNWFVAAFENWLRNEPLYETDEYLSHLPPAWTPDQGLGIGATLVTGMTVNFPEEPETVMENLREVAPNVLFWSPRLWEDVLSRIQVAIADDDALKRSIYNLFLPAGYKMADSKFSGKEPGLFWRAVYSLAELAVFRPLRDKVGLGARVNYNAGAILSPDTYRYFHAIGVNLFQLYGTAEVGTLSIHTNRSVSPGSVGVPIVDDGLEITEEGEIIYKIPGTFTGYYNDPEATAEAIRDGYL